MRSEAASGSSPGTGPATEAPAEPRKAAGRKARRKAHEKQRALVEVTLETQMWRHAGWACALLIGGVLLVIYLGIVGKVIGVLLVASGLRRGWKFARCLLRGPGRFRVGEDPVALLPRGLCVTAPDEVEVSAIKQVFFLRRALPWTHASPVLIVETTDRVYAYPRDWFSSDSEQRRVAKALTAQLGRTAESPELAPS
jgi:hypothetical protein